MSGNNRVRTTFQRYAALIFLSFLMLCGMPLETAAQETVDPRSGLLSLVETDMEIPAGPVMLAVRRRLQPVNEQTGMLGKGWFFNWENLLLKTEFSAVVFNSDRLILFELTPGIDESTSPSGDRLLLDKNGGARVQWADGGAALYDPQGRLSETQDANGNKTICRYGQNGRLEKIEGPEQTYLAIHTDSQGNISRIQSSTGLSVYYGYKDGNLVEVRANQGQPTRYRYDENGALTLIERPRSGSVRIAYDALGRVKSRQWQERDVEYYEYNDSERTIRHIDVMGGTTTIRRSEDGLREETTDPLGHKSVTVFNANGLPESVTGPTGEATSCVYDAHERLTELKGCCGDRTRFEYTGNSTRYKSIIEQDGTTYDFSYDDRGNLLFVKRNGTVISALTYYPNGLLKTSRQEGAPEQTFTYYPGGRVKSQVDASGNTTAYAYDAYGNLIREVDAAGRTKTWTYDEGNQPVSFTDPSGARTRYQYDPAGRLVKTTGPAKETTQYRYDDRGNLASVTDPVGRTTLFRYDPMNRITSETDPAGHTYRYRYDAAGNPVETVQPLGGTLTREYNPLGWIIKETDASGLQIQYEYTRAGLLSAVRNSLGQVVGHTYDPAGRLGTVTDSGGGRTSYDYDDRGRLIKITNPDGSVHSYAYDAFGNLLRETDNRGGDVGYAYDAHGRLTTTKRAQGYEVRYHYDPLGRILGWKDNFGGAASFQYNDQDLISAVRNAAGAATQYRYDPAGMPLAVIDPLGNTATMAYSAAGELIKATSAEKETTLYTYDQAENLTHIQHPGGGVTKLAYDGLGNPVAQTTPIGAITKNVYDNAGRLVGTTDPKGQTTTFSYDAAGRLTQKRLADGKTVTYQYDAGNRLIEVNDGSFPIQYAYNPAGLLSGIHYPAIQRRIGYAYDASGRLSEFTGSEGQTFKYEYSPSGLLSKIMPADGKPVTYEYDLKDRLSAVTYPNGVKGSWQYDPLDRPVAIAYASGGKILCGWRYAYDAAGNLVRVTDVQGNTTDYAYDKDNRLVSERNPSTATTYGYLPGGNRGKRQQGATIVKYSYDKADQLLRAGDETFRYDANGNLIERTGPEGSTRYDYDVQNRLVRVTRPDGRQAAFGYAPTGERLWREDAGGRTYFITDGTHLLAELDQTLKAKSIFLHGPGIDNPLMMKTDGGHYFYHGDRLGSIAILTDADAQTAASYPVDAFGNPLDRQKTFRGPFMFTGREYEPDLGLYYYRARYYDPELGRFLNPDPLWDPFNLNPYVYVSNAPTRYRDPSGYAQVSGWLSDEEVLRLHGLDEQQFMKRLGEPQWKWFQLKNRIKAKWGNPLLRSPPWERYHAVNMIKAYLNGIPRHLRGEYTVNVLRQRLAEDIRVARRVLLHGPQEPIRPITLYPANDPSAMGGTQINVPPNLQDVRARGLVHEYRGAETGAHHSPGGTRYDLSADGAYRQTSNQTAYGPLRPGPSTTGTGPAPSPGAAGVPASPSSSSSSVTVQARPGVKPNVNYVGPQGHNKGPDLYNWKKISPKPTGGGAGATELPVTETAGVPVLHMLVTTEQIIKCREGKIPLRECIANILKTNAQWAVIRRTALASGSANTLILLEVVGKGMMYFKLIYDTGNLLYNMSDWLAAEYERWDAEERHRRFADVNLAARLDEDLKAMRRRIQERLEGLAVEKQAACLTLDHMVQKATKSAEEAKKARAAFPVMKGAIEDWKRAPRICEEAAQMWSRLKEIRENVERWNKALKEGLAKAEEVATRCRTVEEADKVRQSLEMAHRTGEGIRQKTEEAGNLARKLDLIKDNAASAKARYEDALAARDRIIDLTNALPTEAALSEAIENAGTAGKVLAEEGSLLNKEIDLLRMGYPDDLKPEVSRKFEELKWLVYDYQSRGSCDTEAGRREYNNLAGEVVEIRLAVESTLKPFLDMDRTIRECPADSPVAIVDTIVKLKTDSETVLEEAKVLLWLAEKCRTAVNEAQSLQENDEELLNKFYIFAEWGDMNDPAFCTLAVSQKRHIIASYQAIVEGPFESPESAQERLYSKARESKWDIFRSRRLPYIDFRGRKCCWSPDDKKTQGVAKKESSIPDKPKTNEWLIYVRVKDNLGKDVTGACVRKVVLGETPCAKEIGGGKYVFGPVRKDPNIPTKTLKLYASIKHRPKYATVETRLKSPAKQVKLGETPTVSVTLVLPFSLEGEDEKVPSFIRSNDTRDSGKKKPSFVLDSTTETGVASPPVSEKTKTTGEVITKPVKPRVAPPQESAMEKPKSPPPNDQETASPKRKKSYRECVQEFCPMCPFLLGGDRPVGLGPDDPCDRCIKANEANIERCMKQQ